MVPLVQPRTVSVVRWPFAPHALDEALDKLGALGLETTVIGNTADVAITPPLALNHLT
jgi:hypothetical protein